MRIHTSSMGTDDERDYSLIGSGNSLAPRKITLLNQSNMDYNTSEKFDLIFADYVYENKNFDWVDKYWSFLKENGVFIAMTDYHSSAEYKVYVQENCKDSNFVNWIVWRNEWGNHGSKSFSQVHDDIIIFSKGKNYKFYPEKVQVEKITAKSKGMNPSGRETKLATSVITDIVLTTVAKERQKTKDGKGIRWQKPRELLMRLFLPFTDEGDLICDPFMGSGTSGDVARELQLNYVGIENDKTPFEIAYKRICQ